MSLSWYYPSSRLYPHVWSPTYSQLYSASCTAVEQSHEQFLNVAQLHPPTPCGSTTLYTNNVQLVPLHLDLAVRDRLDIFLRMILLANSCGVAMTSHVYSHLDVVRQCHTDRHGTDHPRFLSYPTFPILDIPKTTRTKEQNRQTDRTDTSI